MSHSHSSPLPSFLLHSKSQVTTEILFVFSYLTAFIIQCVWKRENKLKERDTLLLNPAFSLRFLILTVILILFNMWQLLVV